MYKVLFDGFDTYPSKRFNTAEEADTFRLAHLSSAEYDTRIVRLTPSERNQARKEKQRRSEDHV